MRGLQQPCLVSSTQFTLLMRMKPQKLHSLHNSSFLYQISLKCSNLVSMVWLNYFAYGFYLVVPNIIYFVLLLTFRWLRSEIYNRFHILPHNIRLSNGLLWQDSEKESDIQVYSKFNGKKFFEGGMHYNSYI